MVELALTIGAVVGVLLSAGFVYYEVGRYAAPQVPVSRFDERKEMIGYTAGLFVGIPLAVFLLFLLSSLPLGEIGGVAVYLGLLIGGTELAQWLLLRSHYFGSDGSGPFYALGFRSGVGGILILAVVTQALVQTNLTTALVVVALVQSAAILPLETAGALLSIPFKPSTGPTRGGAGAGAIFGGVGFFLLGLGPAFGPAGAVVAALVVGAISLGMYRRIARPTLDKVRPPRSASGSEDEEEVPARSAFGRTDR